MESVKVTIKKVTVLTDTVVRVSWRGVSVIGKTREQAIAAFEQNTGMLVKNK